MPNALQDSQAGITLFLLSIPFFDKGKKILYIIAFILTISAETIKVLDTFKP